MGKSKPVITSEELDRQRICEAFSSAWRDALRLAEARFNGWKPLIPPETTVENLMGLIKLFSILHNQDAAQLALDLTVRG